MEPTVKVYFDSLNAGDCIRGVSGDIYMKIDTIKDNSGDSVKTSGRWPYRDYNAINVKSGRMTTFFGSMDVTDSIVKNPLK